MATKPPARPPTLPIELWRLETPLTLPPKFGGQYQKLRWILDGDRVLDLSDAVEAEIAGDIKAQAAALDAEAARTNAEWHALTPAEQADRREAWNAEVDAHNAAYAAVNLAYADRLLAHVMIRVEGPFPPGTAPDPARPESFGVLHPAVRKWLATGGIAQVRADLTDPKG